MSSDPIILQAAIAIPISVALVVYTLIRWNRMIVNLLLACTLFVLTLWLVALALKHGDGPVGLRQAALDLEMITVLFMPTLFVITMAHFARARSFEDSHGPAIAVLTVSGLFLVAYLTDGQHHLYYTDRDAALSGAHPRVFGGPVFWAVQVWCAICDLAGLFYIGTVFARGRTRDERARALLVVGALVVPLIAHVAHMGSWLPVDYTFVPGSLAVTAVFFVRGVHRYGVLVGQTIVRHDLIEHLDDGLLLADEQGIVLDANRAAERVVGADRETMRGVPLLEVLSLLELDDGFEALGERILGLPLDGSRVAGEVRAADGRIIEINGGAVPALGRHPAGRFVSLQDRTAQRRGEQRLRERQKLESIGILAAGVAHEVNNPLAWVRANLAHLRTATESLAKADGHPEDLEIEEMTEVIDESIGGIDRIARIVESMLRFSRRSDERLRAVDVDGVVDEALRLAALRRDASLHVRRLGRAPLEVMASPERLVQVLLNLFLNARQALGERSDGVIEAETGVEDGRAVIHVRDNGPGIAPDVQPRVFDPFFTTRAPDEGTGLGLSIAFDIVREHGGTLELRSEVGFGACFTIRLPALPAQTSERADGEAGANDVARR